MMPMTGDEIISGILTGASQDCETDSQLLTKGEAHAVAEFIDMNFIDSIRNDSDIDSMLWLRRMIHAFDKLCKYSGYNSGYADEEADDIPMEYFESGGK